MSLFPTGADAGYSPAQLEAGRAAGAAASAQKELLQTWLYSTTVLTSGTSVTSASQFQTAQGATSSDTFTRTNMRSSGILPGVRSFTIRSLHMTLFDGTDANVLGTVAAQIGWGNFAVIIGDTPTPDYFQVRAVLGGSGFSSASTTRGIFGDGNIANALSFNYPFLMTVQGNEPFRVDLRWDTAIATAVASSVYLTTIFYGLGARRK